MINLFRYTTDQTKFNFVSMDKITDYTSFHAIPSAEDKILDDATITRLKNNTKNETNPTNSNLEKWRKPRG